jgi:uncharacterized membrane protein HdeD (DUF308 family)
MLSSPLLYDVENLQRRWGWLLALGILMIVLGTIAFIIMPAATLGTVLVLGWLLVVSGIFEIVQVLRVHGWGNRVLHLIGGILGILIGLLVVTHPLVGALAWTLLFAAFFTVVGIFRIAAAVSLKFPNWGWAAFDGAITLLLGILLWAAWPTSAVWFLGLAVGVSLVLRGWTYVMFAVAVHNLPIRAEVRQAA